MREKRIQIGYLIAGRTSKRPEDVRVAGQCVEIEDSLYWKVKGVLHHSIGCANGTGCRRVERERRADDGGRRRVPKELDVETIRNVRSIGDGPFDNQGVLAWSIQRLICDVGKVSRPKDLAAIGVDQAPRKRAASACLCIEGEAITRVHAEFMSLRSVSWTERAVHHRPRRNGYTRRKIEETERVATGCIATCIYGQSIGPRNEIQNRLIRVLTECTSGHLGTSRSR